MVTAPGGVALICFTSGASFLLILSALLFLVKVDKQRDHCSLKLRNIETDEEIAPLDYARLIFVRVAATGLEVGHFSE